MTTRIPPNQPYKTPPRQTKPPTLKTPIEWGVPFEGTTWTPLAVAGYDGVHGAGNYMKRITCRCVCGTVRDVVLTNLRNGQSKSCGCRFNRGRPPKVPTLPLDQPKPPEANEIVTKYKDRRTFRRTGGVHREPRVLSPETRALLRARLAVVPIVEMAAVVGVERHVMSWAIRGYRVTRTTLAKIRAYLDQVKITP